MKSTHIYGFRCVINKLDQCLEASISAMLPGLKLNTAIFRKGGWEVWFLSLYIFV